MSMTHEDLVASTRKAHEALEAIGQYLEKSGSTPEPLIGEPQIKSGPEPTVGAAPVPSIAAGIDHQGTPNPSGIRRALTATERIALRKELRKLETDELMILLSEQSRKTDKGLPLDLWLASGGQARNDAFGLLPGQVAPDVARAIDTSTASALIRQDLEPVLYELFIREFPGFDRIRKEPANGLTHTWQQVTSYGDAQFMGELGTVTDDRSNYVRQTTNVAIIATRRGVSLKSQFAVVAGGSGFNPEQLEMQGGLTALAHRLQYQIFNGHSTDNTGTANNELGLYDPNAFTGLRSILNSARVKNVNPYAGTPEDIRRAINQAAVEVMQQGGRTSMLWGSPLDKEVFDAQQDKNVRYVDRQVDVAVGVTATAVNTVFGALGYGTIPGDAIGAYVPTSDPYSGDQVRDLYLLDERTITMPYLGSEGPTVLDIPIGISGQLTHLFIIFGMWGLAVKAPTFNNKVRVKAEA